ncbi:MAG: redoxin domain-containing protein [Novosphingobium sp.]|nr:redoxin domain-containing protein [Novosphingobium sp.]
MSFKSRLMMPLLFAAMLLTLAGLVMLAVSRGGLEWLGVALASGALPSYMILVIGKGTRARTAARLPEVQLVAAIGLALAAYPVLSGATPSYLPPGLALAGYLVMQWYVWVYSSYGRTASGALALGQPLPDVSFDTLDGGTVSTSDLVGNKTLLVFFRGNWCPLCKAQLNEVRDRGDALAKAGVNVKFVSNQSAELSRELAEELGLPSHMEILVDTDLKAASALSIVDKGGTPPGMRGYPVDTVMATVVALDEQARVTFGDETDNYRVRPHPDAFMPALVG